VRPVDNSVSNWDRAVRLKLQPAPEEEGSGGTGVPPVSAYNFDEDNADAKVTILDNDGASNPYNQNADSLSTGQSPLSIACSGPTNL
jgi:hypothetical protein